jgi:hypothetical protein
MTLKTASLVSLALSAAAGLSSTATAATVTNIDTTIINGGTCVQTTGCPESYSIVTQGNSTVSLSGASPSSFGFVDSFNQGSGVLNVNTGSNFGPAATGSGAPWNFQDNILFTTTGGTVQVQASATLTNVTNLQLRIISANDAQNNPVDIFTSTNANAASLLGSSVVHIVDGWTNFANPVLGVDYTGVLPTNLAPGSYIIQIRGEAAAGSSYSGTATFTPVPLPAAAWLLLSGILAFVGFARPRALRPALIRA